MITLTDIAYVRSGVADLDAAVRFATGIVGLELAAPTEIGVAHLRADHRHHCLALVEGPSGVIASGFSVAGSGELAAAETELERSGITVHRGSAEEARSRRVREFIAFDDPFGNRLELVSQQETITRPVAFSRPAGITEFGHLCLDAPDVHEAQEFWSTHFNARVSDWIGDWACLLRIDPVHHKLAVFRGERPGLCHMNFQVESIDDLFRNWHFLLDHGVEIEMGPGRHPQSTAIFLYFLGPEGFTYEYSFGVRRIEDDAAWTPRTFDPEEIGSIDMWLGPVRRVSSQAQLLPKKAGFRPDDRTCPPSQPDQRGGRGHCGHRHRGPGGSGRAARAAAARVRSRGDRPRELASCHSGAQRRPPRHRARPAWFRRNGHRRAAQLRPGGVDRPCPGIARHA
jgi:2,3-dihydroxy-p-cumate/2,3-dihydroxybenzoate 3,4-dioxygenase